MGLEENQHAYTPQRGVITAWNSLLAQISKPYIYEFDLKGFFDNVDLKYNKKVLVEEGFPEEIADYLYRMNRSIVTLGPESSDEMDESQSRKVIYNSDGTLNKNMPQAVQKSILKDEKMIELYNLEGYSLYKEKGVPQGAPTSCGLSIANLKDLFEKNEGKLLMYADDGLHLSDEPGGLIPSNEETGVELSVEKSG
jgi:hypothetical protein